MITVRTAATENGSAPSAIACLPKIGATPSMSGVRKAAAIPIAYGDGLTNFIAKHYARIGNLKPAFLEARCAGECSALVPEQIAF